MGKPEQVLEMLEKGATYRECAEALGLSVNSIADYARKARGRRARMAAAVAAGSSGVLSTRSNNGLRNTYVDVFPAAADGNLTPGQVAAFSRKTLLAVYNLGPKSVKEIEEWLSKAGLKLKD